MLTYEQAIDRTAWGDYRTIYHEQKVIRWASAKTNPNAIHFWTVSRGFVLEVSDWGVTIQMDVSDWPSEAQAVFRDMYPKTGSRTIDLRHIEDII